MSSLAQNIKNNYFEPTLKKSDIPSVKLEKPDETENRRRAPSVALLLLTWSTRNSYQE
jgi:hypothetical protein